MNKLFIVLGRKSKFSAQWSDLAPFVGNGTQVKIPSEIKPPLVKEENLHTDKYAFMFFLTIAHIFYSFKEGIIKSVVKVASKEKNLLSMNALPFWVCFCRENVVKHF